MVKKTREPRNLLLDIAKLTEEELNWLSRRITWNHVEVLSEYRDRKRLSPMEIGLLDRDKVRAELDRFWEFTPPHDLEVAVNRKLGFKP